MAGAGGSGVGASVAPFEPQPETVEALLSATVRVIEDERARGETADTLRRRWAVVFSSTVSPVPIAMRLLDCSRCRCSPWWRPPTSPSGGC